MGRGFPLHLYSVSIIPEMLHINFLRNVSGTKIREGRDPGTCKQANLFQMSENIVQVLKPSQAKPSQAKPSQVLHFTFCL